MQPLMDIIQQQTAANAAIMEMVRSDRAMAAETRAAVANMEQRLRELETVRHSNPKPGHFLKYWRDAATHERPNIDGRTRKETFAY